MSQISPKQIEWSQSISASLVPYTSGTLTSSDFSLGDDSSYWGGLYVSGSGSVDLLGVISASEFSGSFFGDASGLTNIPGDSIVITELDLQTLKVSELSELSGSTQISGSTVITGSLKISGSIELDGTINIDNLGSLGDRNDGLVMDLGGFF